MSVLNSQWLVEELSLCSLYSIWLTSVIEVVILTVCLVFSFVVSVTISIGLAITCNAVKAHYGDGKYVRIMVC